MTRVRASSPRLVDTPEASQWLDDDEEEDEDDEDEDDDDET